jgi:hypothetical protein
MKSALKVAHASPLKPSLKQRLAITVLVPGETNLTSVFLNAVIELVPLPLPTKVDTPIIETHPRIGLQSLGG